MWLHRENICKILNLTEVQLLDKIKKNGKRFVSPEKIELIEKELSKNKETYFGIESKNIETNSRSMKQSIRRMLSKDPPEKISIGINETPLDEVNMTKESNELNSSMMSVDDVDEELPLSDPLYKISKKNLIIELKVARQTIMEQQKELDALRPLKNVFPREQKRGGFTYGENIDNIAVDLLCNGETSMGISRFFDSISNEFPILLQCPGIQKSVPRNSYINSLRDILPKISILHLADFLDINSKNGQKYVLTIDQTTVSNNCGILGMGIVNQKGEHHAIGLIESSASKALQISADMKSLIQNTGFYDEIITSTIGLMTDRCAAQLCADRYFIKDIFDEMEVPILQLSCFMHCSSNIEKIYCSAFDELAPDVKTALHKIKLLYGGRKTMGYQRNSLKQMLSDLIGGSKTTIFKSDLGSRYGVYYNNSRNI
jgi:hypothetical protein